MKPNAGEWPWLVTHRDHEAWYQRALLIGDFAPGREPLPNYVLALDGSQVDPANPPRCGGCGELPDVVDLGVIERATGRGDFLDDFRADRRVWPKGTDPTTCWHCNGPGPVQGVAVAGRIVPCCGDCAAYLTREG